MWLRSQVSAIVFDIHLIIFRVITDQVDNGELILSMICYCGYIFCVAEMEDMTTTCDSISNTPIPGGLASCW